MNSSHEVIAKASGPVSPGDLMHYDVTSQTAYVMNQAQCSICKKFFKNPQGVRIHNGRTHK